MCIILAEGYNNANVHILRVRETDDIWVSIKMFIMIWVLKHI